MAEKDRGDEPQIIDSGPVEMQAATGAGDGFGSQTAGEPDPGTPPDVEEAEDGDPDADREAE